MLSPPFLAMPFLAIVAFGERRHLRRRRDIFAGSEQSGIATRKDRARRVHQAGIRGRMITYSTRKNVENLAEINKADLNLSETRHKVQSKKVIVTITARNCGPRLLLLLLFVFGAGAARRKHRTGLDH